MKLLLFSCFGIALGNISIAQNNCVDFQSFGQNYCDTVYTQDIYPVQNSGCLNANNPGIYPGAGNTTFSFDGSAQQITFIGYGFSGQFDQMGYSINNGSVFYLDTGFPMTVGGVQVSLDMSYPEPVSNPGGWEYYSITFIGAVSEIVHESFESGITDVCWGEDIVVTQNCIDFLSYGQNYCDTVYTQNVYPIQNSGCLNANNPGIYPGVGNTAFSFDGSNRQITFIGYGLSGQFDQMGYSVNNSSIFYLDAGFPMTVGGVQVSLDMSYPEPVSNPGGWEYYSITFTGPVSEIIHESFESGITDICWESTLSLISGNKEENVVLFPNPAVNNLTIRSSFMLDEISIVNLLGRAVYTSENLQNSQDLVIDLADLNSGAYVIMMSSGKKTYQRSFIKM